MHYLPLAPGFFCHPGRLLIHRAHLAIGALSGVELHSRGIATSRGPSLLTQLAAAGAGGPSAARGMSVQR
jgi:hypothetical protein